MRIQVTLTVSEGKRLIAKGVIARADARKALRHGKILLKGGTTVSAVCEELCGHSLRISGRVTQRGTVSSADVEEIWHCAMIEKGSVRNIDGEVEKAVERLEKGDIVITGANAFDHYGNAAMMIGRALGGRPGLAWAGMMSEVGKVIVAVGIEKMVRGNLNDTMMTTGRGEVDLAMGMAVGLIPIRGEIFTEIEAIETLAKVRPQIIGRGGVKGAEGATTIIIDGEREEALKIFKLIQSLKGSTESGLEGSLEECCPGRKCKFHLGCIYAKKIR